MPYRNAYLYVLALIALTFVAFWPTYLSDLPNAHVAHHYHAGSAVLWTILAAFQAWSIHHDRFALHRTVGLSIFALFPFFLVAGLWREVYSDMFFDSAKESFGHARMVGEKIVALGGVPTVERNPIKQSEDVLEMLKAALEFETKAVKYYSEALALAEGDRPLEVWLENLLDEEQEGADKITRILRDTKAVAASHPVGKVG